MVGGGGDGWGGVQISGKTAGLKYYLCNSLKWHFGPGIVGLPLVLKIKGQIRMT